VTLSDRAEVVVNPDAGRPVTVVAAALAASFGVVAEPPRTYQRTWLDTFDWRLFRAGLTLEYVTGPDRTELALATIDGQQLGRSLADRHTWPARLNGARLGEVGERIAAVAGTRALLPVAGTTGKLASLRLLNGDEKTVVRAGVEEITVISPAAGRLMPRVRLIPVRGYDREAKRARRALSTVAGMEPNGTSQLEEALAAAGRRPGDYTGLIEVSFSASASASSAMAAVLLHVLDVLAANVDGVVRDLDTEFLHDLRIAVRRTRSGLALAGDALPAGLVARFGDEFKWLGRLTTPVRDLDACLAGLAETALAIAPADADALEPVRSFLERRRHAVWPELAAGLQSPRFAALLTDWRAALLAVPSQHVDGERTVAQLATARITRGYNRVLKLGKAITPSSPADDLHELRKRGKELRYLLEYFAPIQPPPAHRAMIKELKSVQDCLGRFQDSQIQREAITALGEQLAVDEAVSAPTLRAIDQLAAGLDVQERNARNDFTKRFKQFAGARTVGLLMALVDPAAG
jgi:CHAD domain-containing protein